MSILRQAENAPRLLWNLTRELVQGSQGRARSGLRSGRRDLSLFKDDRAYPSDREGGTYVELDGVIIEVDDPILSDSLLIRVNTEEGEFSGFATFLAHWTFKPLVGMFATIRIYDAGGGWYPDNKITSYRTPASDIPKLKKDMQFLRKLLLDLASAGSREQVADILVACDSSLSREAYADKGLIEELVGACNKRLRELDEEETKVSSAKAQ